MNPTLIMAIIGLLAVGGVGAYLSITTETVQAEPSFFESLTQQEQGEVIESLATGDTVFIESQSNEYLSKYFTPPNKFDIEIGSDVINYYNDTGSLHRINTVILGSDDLLYDWEGNQSIYKAYFKNTPDTAQTVKIERDGHELYLQPNSLNYRNNIGQLDQIAVPASSHASIDGNNITYPDILGAGIDLVYEFRNSYLKQSLIINDFSTIGEPEGYIFPNGHNSSCDDMNVTLDFDFTFDFDDGIDVIVNGQAWDKQNTRATSGQVIFRDINTNETIFKFLEPVTYNNNTNSWGVYELKMQGDKLYIIHKTSYDFARMNSSYPLIIDPTTSMNTTNRLHYIETQTCTELGNCCTFFPTGSCISGITSCSQSGVTIGLTKYVAGCHACDATVDCCRFEGVTGHEEHQWFNMSLGINNSFNAVTVDYATLNLTIQNPEIGVNKWIFANHSDDNSTACGNTDHTKDSHPQPNNSTPLTMIAFNHTPHIQAMLDLNEEIVWFHVYGNADDPSENIITQSTLNISYTVDSCEIFAGKNTEIKCSDNCTFTYIFGNKTTKNLSITGNGNLSFNNFNISMDKLNLSLLSDACYIWYMNGTEWRHT